MLQHWQTFKIDMEPESTWVFATPGVVAKQSMVFLQETGDFFSLSDYYTMRTGLDSYLIKFTISGEGMLEYDGKKYTLPVGSFFWIDCRKPQFYYTSPDVGKWRALWIHFYGANSDVYYENFITNNGGSPVAVLADADSYIKNVDALTTMYRDGVGNVDVDTRASALIMSIMSECITSVLHKTKLSKPEQISQAQTYILANYRERITLDLLAQKYSLNKFYFQKLFKHHVGSTPNEYLLATRLAHAKEELRNTDNPISEIAYNVGMSNTSYFIKQFKMQEGVTPNTFRQQWNNC